MLRSHFATASRFAPTFSWMTASDNCYVLLSRWVLKPFCFVAVHKRGLICFEVSSHFIPRSFSKRSRHDLPRRSPAGPSLRICSPLVANRRSTASSCDSRPVRISVCAANTATMGWLCCFGRERGRRLVNILQDRDLRRWIAAKSVFYGYGWWDLIRILRSAMKSGKI